MEAGQNHKEAEMLARRAGIAVPEERIPLLAAGLAGTKRLAEQLSRYDFGRAELPSRFQAPGE
jgi:hypothetical protein